MKLYFFTVFVLVKIVCVAQNTNFEIATRLFLQKDYSKAIPFYSNAIFDEPDSPDPYFNRALSFFHLNMEKEFCFDLHSAILLNDDEAQNIYSKFCVNYDTTFLLDDNLVIYATDKYKIDTGFVKIYAYENSSYHAAAKGFIIEQDTIGELTSYTNFFNIPYFSTGNDSLFALISSKIVYPEIAIENDIQGRVILLITVSKNGNVVDAEIYNSADYVLDEEAIRVAKTLTGFVPAKLNNKQIIAKTYLEIQFKLQ